MDTVYIHNALCENYRLSIYFIRLFMAEDSSNNCKLKAIKCVPWPILHFKRTYCEIIVMETHLFVRFYWYKDVYRYIFFYRLTPNKYRNVQSEVVVKSYIGACLKKYVVPTILMIEIWIVFYNSQNTNLDTNINCGLYK